jgi:hypothetical protein
MKTKTFYTVIWVAFLAACTSQAAVRKETRQAAPFETVSGSNGIDVIFTESNLFSIVVEAEEDMLKDVVTEVSSGVLKVEYRRNVKNSFSFTWKNRGIRVYISAPLLKEIRASGGSNFIAGKVTGNENCRIELSGGAGVKINSMTVNGTAHVNGSGAADCEIKSLRTREGNFTASGAAGISVNIEATGNVTCSASGGADISVSGRANTVNALASGGADINISKLVRTRTDSRSSGGGQVIMNNEK